MGLPKGECKPKIKFQLISQLKDKHSISLLCEVAKVSKSGYYKWEKRQTLITEKDKSDQKLKALIQKIYKKEKGIFGYRRIQDKLLRKYKMVINHKRVYRLMGEMGLKSKIRKKKPNYNQKNESAIVSSNILNREFSAEKPNQKWVTDITYLIFNGRRMYLSVIYDLFNNEVISYEISNRNDNELVLNTVKKAIKKVKDVKGIILHSDQGSQYTSKEYNLLLKNKGLVVSMSRRGNCLDNAAMESFFSHFKSECFHIQKFKNEKQLTKEISKYIRFYNYDRYQSKLNKMAPVEYRNHLSQVA